VISPGEATALDGRVVRIKGATTYPHRDAVRFLTVLVTNRDPVAWEVVRGWLDSDVDVERRGDVVGCISGADNDTLNARLMQQSQNDAKDVALRRVGYTVTTTSPELTVIEACAGVPAYHALAVGDVLTAIDGQPLTSLADVGRLVKAHRPGDRVRVTFSRSGASGDATITAGHFTRAGDCRRGIGRAGAVACLGIVSEELADYEFPIDVKIDTGRVSGPSAGLAFALAIIDDLTPGRLIGPNRVAVTGSIAPDGTVGAVGGVTQKAITARHNHVALMIVPKEEAAAARKEAGSTRVVGVHTLDQALEALRAAGGDAIP
jgi:PDZ domain-containing protein